MFVLDGMGALLSVVLLGVVLPRLQPWLGMPLHIFYMLALWALGSLIYDGGCFLFVDHKNPRYLKGIMAANVLYCGLTACLLVGHFTGLTLVGILYFLAEMPVILGLVMVERRIFRECFSEEEMEPSGPR